MSWAIVASIGIKAVSGFLGSKGKDAAANTAAFNQETLGLQGVSDQWATNRADNQAIAEANLNNQIRNGYRLGLQNVQRAQAKRQALSAGAGLSRAKEQALGSATATAAAAGTIGSSVDAVMADLNNAAQEAGAQQVEDYRVTQENFDTQLHDLLVSAEDQLLSVKSATVRNPAKTVAKKSQFGEALFAGALETGGQYASSYMSLGAGS